MTRTALIAASLLLTSAALAQAPAGNRINVNGMQMYYEVSGTGDPLVVLHGAYMPATAHTAVITQPDLLHAFIEPFLKGQTPKGMFENP